MLILQLFLVVVCAVTSSFSCSCMPLGNHPQKQFCDADFALLAYVKSKRTNAVMPNNPYPGIVYDAYTLTVRETFKGHSAFESHRYAVVELYTLPSFGSCAVNLAKGYYILTGTFLGGNLYTKFCNLQKKWKDVTWKQLMGMRGEYNKGCGCSMGLCVYPKCRQLLPGCEGFHNNRNVNHVCREKYQQCSRNGATCAWVGRRCDQVSPLSFSLP
ncbi:metalloproteinase inhibitor 3-like [Montipora capricornis]|uniref:metalloproteinase inhibitor 3-like n=1 Tax=Montipora foliosa TaxID=591990 RepID=UPI0035F1F7A6